MKEETVAAKRAYRLEKVEFIDPETNEWKTVRHDQGLKNAQVFMGTLLLVYDDHREIIGTEFRVTERAVLVPVEPEKPQETPVAVGMGITATCDQPVITDRHGKVINGKEQE